MQYWDQMQRFVSFYSLPKSFTTSLWSIALVYAVSQLIPKGKCLKSLLLLPSMISWSFLRTQYWATVQTCVAQLEYKFSLVSTPSHKYVHTVTLPILWSMYETTQQPCDITPQHHYNFTASRNEKYRLRIFTPLTYFFTPTALP